MPPRSRGTTLANAGPTVLPIASAVSRPPCHTGRGINTGARKLIDISAPRIARIIEGRWVVVANKPTHCRCHMGRLVVDADGPINCRCLIKRCRVTYCDTNSAREAWLAVSIHRTTCVICPAFRSESPQDPHLIQDMPSV